MRVLLVDYRRRARLLTTTPQGGKPPPTILSASANCRQFHRPPSRSGRKAHMDVLSRGGSSGGLGRAYRNAVLLPRNA